LLLEVARLCVLIVIMPESARLTLLSCNENFALSPCPPPPHFPPHNENRFLSPPYTTRSEIVNSPNPSSLIQVFVLGQIIVKCSTRRNDEVLHRGRGKSRSSSSSIITYIHFSRPGSEVPWAWRGISFFFCLTCSSMRYYAPH
jgi:hypothetical protein